MLNTDLIEAYKQTNYCFNHIVLNINKISIQTKALLEPFQPKGGVFITAWNPLGDKKSDEENYEANQLLKADLMNQGLTVIDGYGESRDGAWREDSFFAYPIDEASSLQLCQQYQQNAVVYVDHQGLAKLIFSNKDAT